ncbi:MAG: hypothetical protein JWQ35_2353 [Bacteriovoracaceae bacterium]|nr:hypothetical protein [Bacteriovoracaceae bacterium]
MSRLKKISKGDFFEFLENLSKTYKNNIALSCHQSSEWKLISFRDLHEQVLKTASRLQMAGLKKGERVVLLGESSIEWVIHFFAVLLSGGIAIPLDIKLADTEMANILSHSEPSLLLASLKFRELARNLRTVPKRASKVLILNDGLSDSLIPSLPFNRVKVSPEDPVVICYTSGTSGSPKGVMVPLRTFLFEADAMANISRDISTKDVMLSVLPLNHLFGLGSGLLFSLRCGMEFCMAHDLSPDAIVFCFKSRRVTHFQVVPLFLKLMMREIQRKSHERMGELKFRSILKSAKLLRFNTLKKMAFKKIHEPFGGTLKRFVCGGSELDPQIFDFFSAIGTPIYNGYGLTETGPVIATNAPKRNRRGSVGLPLPGVKVKIANGEIITKGPHLMLGYYRNSELSRESMDDKGWFYTGDMGYLDKKGFLYLNGRKKNLVVLSNGKKIHPEEVESALSKTSSIKEICVVGLPSSSELGEKIVAIVIPAENSSESDVRAEIARLSNDLATYKRPSEIIIRRESFPVTASMKIKRHLVKDELLQTSLGARKGA